MICLEDATRALMWKWMNYQCRMGHMPCVCYWLRPAGSLASHCLIAKWPMAAGSINDLFSKQNPSYIHVSLQCQLVLSPSFQLPFTVIFQFSPWPKGLCQLNRLRESAQHTWKGLVARGLYTILILTTGFKSGVTQSAASLLRNVSKVNDPGTRGESVPPLAIPDHSPLSTLLAAAALLDICYATTRVAVGRRVGRWSAIAFSGDASVTRVVDLVLEVLPTITGSPGAELECGIIFAW